MTNKRFFATFAIGALFGASVLLTIRGHDLDQLYLRNYEARSQLAQLQEDYKNLEQELSHAQKLKDRHLKKISVEVSEAPDEFTKLAVQKKVKEELRTLVNKDLSLLEEEPELFKQLLEKRVYQFPSQSITLEVTFVAIGETTTVYVKAIKQVESLTHSVEKGTPLP
jgi:hypothetical protein